LAYFEKGNYEQAIESSEKAVSIMLKAFGGDYPNLAEPYDNLGEIYQARGENDRALSYYNKAYIIWLEKLGPEHPDTLRMVTDMANLAPGE
jgi:tetratricopeptide (TPR) repeat protein